MSRFSAPHPHPAQPPLTDHMMNRKYHSGHPLTPLSLSLMKTPLIVHPGGFGVTGNCSTAGLI